MTAPAASVWCTRAGSGKLPSLLIKEILAKTRVLATLDNRLLALLRVVPSLTLDFYLLRIWLEFSRV